MLQLVDAVLEVSGVDFLGDGLRFKVFDLHHDQQQNGDEMPNNLSPFIDRVNIVLSIIDMGLQHASLSKSHAPVIAEKYEITRVTIASNMYKNVIYATQSTGCTECIKL